ncbi:hypothetical protein ACIREE_41710 [Streptomyces sp. NPDC102467]|uniref:hypothetical protein n=1 Tax=Streptomyces sp. NPDC102467 TaxID=3366179 RepID=UPI0037F6FE9D
MPAEGLRAQVISATGSGKTLMAVEAASIPCQMRNPLAAVDGYQVVGVAAAEADG